MITAQGVLGVNAFKDVAAGIGNIFGGRSKSYENELTAEGQLRPRRVGQACRRGGCRRGSGCGHRLRDVGSNMLMISASGTRSS